MAARLAPHRHQYCELCVRLKHLGSTYQLTFPRFYYPGVVSDSATFITGVHISTGLFDPQVGNEVGTSDPVFMSKHKRDLEKDSGKWIDSSVWHGKAHTWEKIPWLIKEVNEMAIRRSVY